MASRDNQTLQIIVIVLTLLVIGLGVGLLLVNNARKTAVARAADAESRAQDAAQAERDIQTNANNYKQWMGFQEDDSYETIQQAFNEDMEKYGSTFDETSRFYRTILDNLHTENRRLAQSEVAAKDQVKDLTERLAALEKEKNEQIAQFRQDKEQLQQELASERNKFNQQRDEMASEKQNLADQLAQLRSRIDELNAEHQAKQNELNEQIAGLERDIEILRGNQADPDPFAQPADGMIRWVNQRARKVWINIGEADQLRPQVSFSVYSGDQADALRSEKKGSIEVTKILGPHMAEARITSDQPTRPLMEGDQVYSQVWNRGRQAGFAIAGLIDINEDGKSDLEQLKNVIEMNKGKVDAMPDGQGGVEGQMTVDTRYLVLGEFPEGTQDEDDALRRSWESMTENAASLGIETVTLDEFLQLMGWKPERRRVTMGSGARPEDFPPQQEQDYKPLEVRPNTHLFRPRNPQPTY